MKLLLLAAFVSVASAMVSYKDHEVWSLSLNERNDHHHLQSLVHHFHLDVMGEKMGMADVRIPPHQKIEMQKFLKMLKIPYTVVVQDLEPIFQKERDELRSTKVYNTTGFNTWEDIETELARVDSSCAYSSLASIGLTLEGREMWQITFALDPAVPKPAIWIDCGIHAREWITVTTCMAGIERISVGYGSDASVDNLLNNYDILLMPVNNPDGYNYTFSNDRMWRKNRNLNTGLVNPDFCEGVDLNRNFDDHFGGEGTSADPCDETYRGESAASEIETQNVQNKMLELKANNDLTIMYSIHAYSQLWMWPYGWTADACSDNTTLGRVADAGVQALAAVDGKVFQAGPISTTIYPAASTTVDYSYTQVGVTYSYTLELRPDGALGTGGFRIDASFIPIVAEETWAGLFASFDAVLLEI